MFIIVSIIVSITILRIYYGNWWFLSFILLVCSKFENTIIINIFY